MRILIWIKLRILIDELDWIWELIVDGKIYNPNSDSGLWDCEIEELEFDEFSEWLPFSILGFIVVFLFCFRESLLEVRYLVVFGID